MYYTNYGFGFKVEGSFDEIVSRTIGALSEQGFGVLSDIDVSATLKKKLDADFRQYRILGACNPPFAHKALLEEPEIGLLLPCNVIVYETDDNKYAVVAVDPVKNLSIVDNPALVSIAETIRTKLRAALNSFEPVVSGS
jgi:uncharacterized protein (DUF302 family)